MEKFQSGAVGGLRDGGVYFDATICSNQTTCIKRGYLIYPVPDLKIGAPNSMLLYHNLSKWNFVED